ncbi:DUF2840 domain-containing protein [Consotaella salsifontis]|uniref:Glycosidase n=1 Tax=Consotaella salsifontis TaxID=1365950 RepID=A0A1T4TAN5_9HYPH|nr:DUF2840 domain-containing protein [Consotaella salsifontis]SKA37463.1 Protein of unknown function [Consotaella salsifontis]
MKRNPSAGTGPQIPPLDELTCVELTWIAKKIEFWIRFGRKAGEQRFDRRRRLLLFAPNTVFAFVRWAANDYGTVISRIDIVRAVAPGELYQTLPFVRPGGDILLKIAGWPKVERVLQMIDAVEALGIDPCTVAPDYWRHVHNRLTAGHEPRVYTREQHSAYQLRQRITDDRHGEGEARADLSGERMP